LQDSRYLPGLRNCASALIDAGVPVAEKALNGDSVADEFISRMSKVPLAREIPPPAGQLLQSLLISGSELRSLTEVPHKEYLYHIHNELPGIWHRKTALVQRLYLQNMLGGASHAFVTSDAELISLYLRY
jgi:hypothetical protein